MTILQVLYVLEVARQNSISKAAENLFVSQPALSAQIKRLEQELGCELFHREPQGVSLTAAGRAFCEDAAPVAESWRRLQEGSKRLGNAVCSHIRIGIGARAISNDLFDVVLDFFARHPDTEVSYITDIGENILGALEAKQIHFAIDRLPPDSMIAHPEHFATFELLREKQCILVSPKDPRVGQLDGVPFQTLHNCAVVSGPEHSMDDEIMRRLCQQLQIKVSKIHRADNIDAVMALIRSGRGVALGPESFAKRYGVAAIPLLPETEIALHLICLKQNSKNPLVRQIEQSLKAYIRGNLPPDGSNPVFFE